MARSSSQRHPSVSPQIDRSALKVASDPRKLLAPLPIPAATPAASSALQCAEKRRGGARLAMHDDGSAGCSSAGPVAPYSRVTCRRPDDSLAPPLMEGRSAPLPPRRRWERHWWWPGRPSAAARRARAAVAACAAPASSGRPRFERAPPASSGRPGRVPRFERGDAAWDSLSEMSASKGETPNLISESLPRGTPPPAPPRGEGNCSFLSIYSVGGGTLRRDSSASRPAFLEYLRMPSAEYNT